MAKVKTLADLRKLRIELKSKTTLRERSENPDEIVQIKVAMATCCIASGSREIMNYLADELEKRNIEAIVSQTGCMGYCYAEPTIEVKLPGKEAIVFGYVDTNKANEIIEKYIRSGELVDGIIPNNFNRVDEGNN
jgi:NADP-reducing hydrogenase subunit HndB